MMEKAISKVKVMFFLKKYLSTERMASKDRAKPTQSANNIIKGITAGELTTRLHKGDVILIDTREGYELTREPGIAGSHHVSLSLIDSYADPSLPYHLSIFDKNQQLIVYCSSGVRSALAVQILKEMGYEKIAYLIGGLKTWRKL